MKVSFVIPFHNEERNAGLMIAQVAKYALSKKWDFEIIPVNDRSSDQTQKVLDTYAKKWHFVRPVERNDDTQAKGNTMGKALMAGTKMSQGKIVIWTMGDRADEPKTYGAMVQKIEEGYDMVFGSRYMPGGSRGNLDPAKAFFSSLGTKIARSVFGVPSHDITNAFRGFRRNLAFDIKLHSPGFAISPEFALKAHLGGYRLAEVPTVYYNRVEGVSSFKILRMTITYLYVYLRVFLQKITGHVSIL